MAVIITLAACCTAPDNSHGTPAISPVPTHSIGLPSQNPDIHCPSPELKFNDSTAITRLGSQGLTFTSIGNNSKYSGAGIVPFGGTVYHLQGFTRIFDSSGNQIMIINDTESITQTPGGLVSSTYVYGIPSNVIPLDEPDNKTILHTGDICVATIRFAPGVKPAVWAPNIP